MRIWARLRQSLCRHRDPLRVRVGGVGYFRGACGHQVPQLDRGAGPRLPPMPERLRAAPLAAAAPPDARSAPGGESPPGN